MWRYLSFTFVVASVVIVVGVEVLRSIIHRRRIRSGGVGGTQDVALIGTVAAGACLVLAGIFTVLSWARP